MSETEKIPATWRDNKTVLLLVRVGFLTQFYIPAIIWIGVIVARYIEWAWIPVYQSAPTDLLYTVLSTTVIMVILTVQWPLFALILRFGKLRSAAPVLWCLIVMNISHIVICVLHSIYNTLWPILSMLPFPYYLPLLEVTINHLVPPTILFYLAIRAEKNSTLHSSHSTLP